jgi:hypothetical protein
MNRRFLATKKDWKVALREVGVSQVDILNHPRWVWSKSYLSMLLSKKRPIMYEHALALSTITGIDIERIHKPIG